MDTGGGNAALDRAHRNQRWSELFWGTILSVLFLWPVLSGDVTFAKWQDWLVMLGAVAAPVYTVVRAISIWKGWSLERFDRVVNKAVAWSIIGPLLLAIGAWIVFSIFGWFATVPSWAVLIIILLVIIALKK